MDRDIDLVEMVLRIDVTFPLLRQRAVLELSDANLTDRCHVRVRGFDIDSNKLHLKRSQAAYPRCTFIQIARIQSAHSLGSFVPRARLVTSRQTFVRRCQWERTKAPPRGSKF